MANANATINIKALLDNSDVIGKVKQIQNTFSNLKLPNEKLNKSFTDVSNKYLKSLQDAQDLEGKGFKSTKDVTAYSKAIDQVTKTGREYETILQQISTEIRNSPELSKIYKLDPSIIQQLSNLSKEVEIYKATIKESYDEIAKRPEIAKGLDKLSTKKSKEYKEEIQGLLNKGEVDSALDKARELQQILSRVQTMQQNKFGPDGSTNVKNSLTGINEVIKELENSQKAASSAQQEIEKLNRQRVDILENETEKLAQNFDEGARSANEFNNQVNDTKGGIESAAKAEASLNREIDQMKSRISYFFGLNNAISLFQRALRSAFNTVKELDQAMTETAVVTDFTVGDMWSQLPKYTKAANELGVTTLGAYQTMTLFYQQGLNTNQAFEVGTETMKMARIAGLDYATATDYMTAALRGFNMEINETSAKRVNDVYSELAAITASDTEEISVAMTKTASLAHNANMEFETTSAYLSQIIETTRESAETAGTALKTVIARFTELKKDPSLIGEVEGETVDANKIETALKSIGVALRDEKGQFRDLDDVFLDINERWDGLTTNQQRYIATMAAGSRQQSRFIAMMSDYNRTQELMSAAYNSAGASERQFEKTQDSLESKLNKLKNAWNEFTMGLANNTLIKAGVDALTGILTVVNKLTTGFGLLEGNVGSFVSALLKIGVVAASLNTGELLTGAITGKIAGVMTGKPQTWQQVAQAAVKSKYGQDEQGNPTMTFGQALKRSSPIGTAKQIFSDIKSKRENRANENNILSSLIEEISTPSNIQEYSDLQDDLINKLGTNLFNGKITDKISSEFTAKLANGILKSGNGKIANALAKVLGTGASKAGVTAAAGLAAAFAEVLIVVTAVASTIALIYRLSPAGQVKNAQKYADAMQNAADAISNQAKATKEMADAYKENQKTISETSSVTERQAAINESNAQVIEFIQKNSEFAELLTTGEFGQMTLEGVTEAGKELEDLLLDYQERAAQAQTANLLSQAKLAEKQSNLYNYKSSYWRSAAVDGHGNVVHQNAQNKSLEFKNQAETYSIKSSKFAAQAYRDMVGDAIEDSNFADSISQALSEGFDSKELKRGKYLRGARFNVDNTYESMFGEAPEDMNKDQKKRAIQQANATEAIDNKVDTFVENINRSNEQKYQEIFDLYNGTYQGSAADLDIESILKKDKTELEEFAKYLGKAPGILEQEIKDRVKDLEKVQSNRRKELKNTGIKANLKEIEFGQFDLTTYENQINSLTESQAQVLSGIYDKVYGNVSEDTLAWLTKDLPEMVKTNENDIAKLFSTIDFSNPISAFKQLRDDSNKLSSSTKNLSKNLLESENTGLFSKENLVQSFLLSSSYDSLTEQLQEFQEENGQITAANIEELSDSCSDLNTLLDEGVISANGLAQAINAVNDGAPIDGLTTSVLEALSSVDSLDASFSRMKQNIEGFKEGEDYTEGIDIYSKRLADLKELTDKYEYGNDAVYKLFDNIFGEGSYENLIDEYITKGEDNVLGLNEEVNRMMSQAAKLLENDGEGIVTSLEKAGVLTRDNGKLSWSPTSTKEAKQQLSEATGIDIASPLIDAFLQRMRAILPNLADELKLGDYKETLDTFTNSKSSEQKKINGKIIASESELSVIAKSFGKDIEEVRSDLKQSSIAVADWNLAASKGAQALKQEFNDVTGISIEDFFKQYSGNVEQAFSTLSDIGISDKDIGTLISTVEGLGADFKTSDGKFEGDLATIWADLEEYNKRITDTDFSSAIINSVDGVKKVLDAILSVIKPNSEGHVNTPNGAQKIDNKNYTAQQKEVYDALSKVYDPSQINIMDGLFDIGGGLGDGLFTWRDEWGNIVESSQIFLDGMLSASDMLDVAQHEYAHLLSNAAIQDWGNNQELVDVIDSIIPAEELAQAKKNLLNQGYKPEDLYNELFSNLMAGQKIWEEGTNNFVDLSKYTDAFLNMPDVQGILQGVLDGFHEMGELKDVELPDLTEFFRKIIPEEYQSDAHTVEQTQQNLEADPSSFETIKSLVSVISSLAQQAAQHFEKWRKETGEAYANAGNLEAILTNISSKARQAADDLMAMGGGMEAMFSGFGLGTKDIEKAFGTSDIQKAIGQFGFENVLSTLAQLRNTGLPIDEAKAMDDAASQLVPLLTAADQQFKGMNSSVTELATGLATIIEQCWDIVAGAAAATSAILMLSSAASGISGGNTEGSLSGEAWWNKGKGATRDDGGKQYSESVYAGIEQARALQTANAIVNTAIENGTVNAANRVEALGKAYASVTEAINDGATYAEAYNETLEQIPDQLTKQTAQNLENSTPQAPQESSVQEAPQEGGSQEVEITQIVNRQIGEDESKTSSEDITQNVNRVINDDQTSTEPNPATADINYIPVLPEGVIGNPGTGTVIYSPDVSFPPPVGPTGTGIIEYKPDLSGATPAHGKLGSFGISNLPGFATGKNNSIYASKNWYGSGTESGHGAPRTYEGLAQVGEEGPELIINQKGQASLAGINGPTFTYVHKNDSIFTAGQTKRILGQHPDQAGIPGFANGLDPFGKSGKGGSGGTTKGEGDDKWKNELDWLYNILEDIVELERDQQKLEEKHDNYLNDVNKNYLDLVKLTRDQIGNLREQERLQEYVLEKRKEEMQTYLDENKDMAEYGTFNFDDMTIEIDWDKINALGKDDKDKYDEITEYIDGLEEIQDKIDDTEDSLQDIQNTIEELQERYHEEFTDMEERIYDAVVETRQKEIDKLSDVSDAIENTNSRLLDAVSNAISKQRQDRENDKTEQDLAEKERRLAYLRQDTSGNNALEIKELEKELEESRQDYLDNLVDQKLDTISEQEDFAAEQRERQIELMQAQLDWQETFGFFWQEVRDMFLGATDADGNFKLDSQLSDLLKNIENFEGMSDIGQIDWLNQLVKDFNPARAYYEDKMTVGKEDYDYDDVHDTFSKEISFTNGSGKILTGIVDKDGNVIVIAGDKYTKEVEENGKLYRVTYQDYETYGEEGAEVRRDHVNGEWYSTENNGKISSKELSREDITPKVGEVVSGSNGGGGGVVANNKKTKYYYVDKNGDIQSTTNHDEAVNKSNEAILNVYKNTGIQVSGYTVSPNAYNLSATSKEIQQINKLLTKVDSGSGADSIRAEKILINKQNKAKASGGIIKSPETSLTGEEGPELLWNKEGGYSYLLGANGPEFAKLKPGDQIFDAKTTTEIMNRPFANISNNANAFLSNASGTGQMQLGNNTVTITIDANIGSDYDVDKLTEKIKKDLYNSGTYRNVNVINRIR